MIETFSDVRADIVSRLTHAANQRKSAMHAPVVATADADARVMVLREFDADSWTLRFHTDARAPKAQIIDAGNREGGAPVGVLFYDKAEKIQIRARGNGQIIREGPLVDTAWETSPNFARRCYLGEGPGAVSDTPTSGLPSQFEGVEPDDDQLIPARANFALLLVRVSSFDWFHLAHTGHVRAVVERESGRWVAP